MPYFPKDIDTFYDLFGGSGVVSMNVNAKNYVLNDFNEHIYNLWNMFKTKSSDEIISYCYEMRDKFNFSINETVKTKIAENNKIPFQKFRDYVNENPSTLGYYCLTFYSFCNQFRFSRQKKFNMPVGNGYFKKESESLIKDMCNFLLNDNVLLKNKSYEEVELKSPNECFIYADVPLHPTEKPIELMEKFILNSTNEGDTVLDPFLGIGSCGVASVKNNRNFIGCELDSKYFEIAKNRIENNGEYIKNSDDIFDMF